MVKSLDTELCYGIIESDQPDHSQGDRLPRFSYSASALGKKMYRGRRVPTLIKSITERVRENGRGPIPSLTIEYEPPDKSLEHQEYTGGEDCIPPDSELGMLITAFSVIGVDDIGKSNFRTVIGRYAWIEVTPVQRKGQSLSYKRYPTGWMSDAEVQEHFHLQVKQENLLGFLTELIPQLEHRLPGCKLEALIPSLMSMPAIKPHIQEVTSAIADGRFVEWLEKHTSLCSVTEDEGAVLRQKSKTGE